jgi:glycogen debranching enzyme
MLSIDGSIVPRETVEVRRQRQIDGRLHETVRVTNFNAFAVTLEYAFRFGADFADIFEVRGQERSRRGLKAQVVRTERSLLFSYATLDGRELRTRVTFDRNPVRIEGDSAWFRLQLGPREQVALGIVVCAEEGDAREVKAGAESPWAPPDVAAHYRHWKDDSTRFLTSNEIFNAVLDQSLNDLRTLWNDDGNGGGYLSAGTPWFDTLFGRDSLIAALETLALKPRLARLTLEQLARRQGVVNNQWRDEEPGKILHETRSGEMSRVGELPFALYYGSIDSTPLFLLLAAEYWRWTADTAFLRTLKPALLAALEWVRLWGDRDGDGFIEYERRSDAGLLNQGWKDSGDAIVNVDGWFASPPIALVEVQAYLYSALVGLVPVATALRDPVWADALRSRAAELRRRFERAFWVDEAGFYALALDGAKRPVESITSNPGHALFAGIVSQQHGAAVAARLMQPDMFSGWGIRTLSTRSVRFNPMGYHTGSIWPHDNALIAAGFKRYGQENALTELATAIYDTARAMEYYRLPELFCGSPRSAEGQPVPYPVACRPQSWAAGAIPLMLTALLGLCPDASRGELSVVSPQLPYWLDRVQVRGLRVGGGTVDLLFELHNRRTQVTVLSTTGGLGVTVVPRWPAIWAGEERRHSARGRSQDG